MNETLFQDLLQMDQLLQQTKDISAAFLAGIDNLPVDVAKGAFAPLSLPKTGMGASRALSVFQNRYKPMLAGNAGARYWGFVTGGATPAAIAGDWLTSVYDMNAANKDGASFHIEGDTIALLRQLFGLPDAYTGVFTSGATMSNFSGLAIARQWLGHKYGIDVAQEGVGALPGIKILSCTPHSSTVKSMAMLGIGRNALIKIPSLPDRESVDIAALTAYLDAHAGEPLIFVAAAGTVNTVDFDHLQSLAVLKQQYGFYLHVDAAFGGFAACHPDYRNLLQGWEAADSITIDAHKWLNVPYDAAMIFTRHPKLQMAAFRNVGASYLPDPDEFFVYSNYTPENSRRLRALPAWHTLMAYGINGYADIVENNVRLTKKLGNLIAGSDQFRLLAPVNLCVACFTLNAPEDGLQDAVGQFLQSMNESGKVVMTPTVYQGIPGIRAALVNWRTTDEDVDIVWEEMSQGVHLHDLSRMSSNSEQP